MRRLLLRALVPLLLLWTAESNAIHPERADADAERAYTEESLAFCKNPKKPLSFEARKLCGVAAKLPDCEELVRACDIAPKPPKRDFDLGPLPEIVGEIAKILVWLLIFGAVGFLLFLLARALLRKREAEEPQAPEGANTSPLPTEEEVRLSPAQTLLSRADELLSGGRFAEAIQLYLSTGLRALDMRGTIKLARDRTNGEYVRSCRDVAARAPLLSLVGESDRIQFGGDPATHEGALRARERAVHLLNLAAPLVFLLLLGCSGGSATGKGADPAGDDLLFSLLKRQGLTVERSVTPLASLPLPKDDEPAPTVVVDITRVRLDEETEAHLERWVSAGGTLVLAGHSRGFPKKFKREGETGEGLITCRALAEEDDTPFEIAADLETTDALDENKDDTIVASYKSGHAFAVMVDEGKGHALLLASSMPLRNAMLRRPGTGSSLMAILSHASPTRVLLPLREAGTSPSSNPISGLSRAGLGPLLLHATLAALLMFFGLGRRLARARPDPIPQRRAFSEHIEATGALYARANAHAHAASHFLRFTEERLRTKMPRGEHDLAAFAASRAEVDPTFLSSLWERTRSGALSAETSTRSLLMLVRTGARALRTPKDKKGTS